MSKRPGFNSLPIAARTVVVLFGLAGFQELIHALGAIRVQNYSSLALMLLLAVGAALMRVQLIGGRSTLSMLTPVVLGSLLMLGGDAAVLVSVCGMVAGCVTSKKRAIEIVFNTAMIALSVSMAGMAYNQTLSSREALLSEEFVGTLVASFVYFLGDSLYLSLIISLAKRKSIFRVWHDTYLYTAPSYFIAGELSFAAVKLTAGFHPIALVVLVPVFYSTFYSYRVYLQNLEEQKRHAEEMSALYSSTLSTLVSAIDAKDKNTHGHIQRVQKYSRAIAEAMKLEEKQVETVAAAALLHDIGKLAVPDYILSKAGALTPEEMNKMRLHPQLGHDIISNIKFPYPVADSVLAHHERWDGKGYPNGLKGKDIPLAARVLAIADVFDTVTSRRNPESPETIRAGVEAVHEGSGTFFDPEIVAVWESICWDVMQLKSGAADSTAYRNIQLATSEVKILESLADSITGLTGFDDIASAVRTLLESSIRRCSVSVRQGRHEGVPVVYNGAVIATISMSRPDAGLTEDETRLITAVAEKISGRLNNAIALDVARREATLDELTGIPNRRAFERMSTSMRGRNFSIVVVDVNAFKAVNDNFGHQAGDAALIRIAGHLQEAFTHAELICRFGGDEFLVVTSADRRKVRMQTRTFRRMVVSDPLHEPYKRMNFGVSCGAANVPGDAPTTERAIRLADERMYKVKARAKQWRETPALTA